MRKTKRRALINRGKEDTTKVCPELEIAGPLMVSSGESVRRVAKQPADEREEKQLPKASGVIKTDQARIKFFDEFFSENNKMPLGRVMVYSNSFPRKYTVVRFAGGNFREMASYGFGCTEYVPLPLRDYESGLEAYLRYLYSNGVSEVEYFEGMVNEDFQAMIKALVVDKDLDLDELEMIETKNGEQQYTNIPIARIRKGGNALYWYKKDIVPALTEDYLEAVQERYEHAMERRLDEPDLDSLYAYFKEFPHPDMKVLRLDDASDNTFKFM